MAPPPVTRSPATVCKFCERPAAVRFSGYLDIKPLCSHELPPLDCPADLDHATYVFRLTDFLRRVLFETYQINFDGEAWVPHGKFPSSKGMIINMPPLPHISNANPRAPLVEVPIQADMRVNGIANSAWLARRSRHQQHHVEYRELDEVLARDHCGQEVLYTPSVFDANELFKWDPADLQQAAADLDSDWKIMTVQMSIYQMCHEMPKLSRISLLRDRIFHVLCITVHSLYDAPEDVEHGLLSQSHTLQLPVDIQSFRDMTKVTCKSRFRQHTKTYNAINVDDEPIGDATSRKWGQMLAHQGNKMIEGVYVSLERLREGPTTATGDQTHLWDMMTKSDARGMTSLAPWNTRKKGTLDAVAKDVLYVLEHIRRNRQSRVASDDTPIAQ